MDKTCTKKKDYEVHVLYTMVHTVYVEAADAEEAARLAYEKFPEEDDLSSDEFDEVLFPKPENVIELH